MIFKAESEKILLAMRSYRDDLFALKIEALINSYGDCYDFCSYFFADGAVLSKYYGDFVIAGKIDDNNAEEIARFIQLSGFSAILCEISNGKVLEKYFDTAGHTTFVSNIVEFSPQKAEAIDGALVKNPSLDEVYEILSEAFELDYESWYVDASHRVRHGVSDYYVFDGKSTVCVAFDIRKNVFLSLVGTKRQERGKGTATKMLKTLCSELTSQGKKISLICLDERLDFYKNTGFVSVGKACNIKRSISK